MAESVKVRAEGSVFSVKKGTLLSDVIPRLKLSKEPLFARIDGQLALIRGQALSMAVIKNLEHSFWLNILTRPDPKK